MAPRSVTAAILAVAGLTLVRAQPSPSIAVARNVEARMRDGVILRADIYRPDTTSQLPALLERTPYSKRPGTSDALFEGFAEFEHSPGRLPISVVAALHDEDPAVVTDDDAGHADGVARRVCHARCLPGCCGCLR